MIINFDKLGSEVLLSFKGGEKQLTLSSVFDGMNKIMRGLLIPGATIGLHTHIDNSEIIYIVSGKGKVLCDGELEAVRAGECHYCPKGHEHSLINDSEDDLIFFAVVPQQ